MTLPSTASGVPRRRKERAARVASTTIVIIAVVLSATIIGRVTWTKWYFVAPLEGLDSSTIEEDLVNRIGYLETKLNSYLAFTSDPFLANKAPATCQNAVMIKELACQSDESCALDNQSVCLDQFPVIGAGTEKSEATSATRITTKNCVVYDFGIRESPEYGLAFAKAPFNCQVIGFDPSPISVKWWEKKKDDIRTKYPSYEFQAVGAGGHDGMLVLREYDWGQVSIIGFPELKTDVTRCEDGACKYIFYDLQKEFRIPVKTLSTIMTEQGHQRIDLLKLDVEGGEYLFLEKMIEDLSCRQVDQITLEWHHYDHDIRYGVTSSPQRNLIVALLSERCGLEQFWTHSSNGWPSNHKLYAEMGMTLYYTLSSFKRTKWDF